jgi:RNA polymerase sigma-70 factor, ECF subfamily
VRLSTEQAKAIEAEIPYLRRYARALTGNPDAADDLVQDGLERAIGRFD